MTDRIISIIPEVKKKTIFFCTIASYFIVNMLIKKKPKFLICYLITNTH